MQESDQAFLFCFEEIFKNKKRAVRAMVMKMQFKVTLRQSQGIRRPRGCSRERVGKLLEGALLKSL